MYDVAAVNTKDDDDHDDNHVQVPSENDPRVQITLDLATRSLYSEPTRNFGVFFFFWSLRPSVEDVPKHLTAH